MLIVLLDEPVLFVYASASVAAKAIEPVDAKSEIRAAFDETAVPYQVEWIRRNRHGSSLFGLLKSVEPGQYRLAPAGPPDSRALLELLESYPDTDPPEARAQLASLVSSLRAAQQVASADRSTARRN